MPVTPEVKLGRRAALAMGLGTLAAGCGQPSPSTQEPQRLPIPTADTKAAKKDTAPLVTPKKEVPAVRIAWTEGLTLPLHPSDLRLTREAFFISGNRVFFTNSQGYPTGHNIERGRVWRWEEDQALVYGADQQAVYAFRQDNRLFALDAQTGQRKWNQVFPTMANANVEWPFLICKDTVHPRFRPSQQRFPFAGVSKENGEIRWISDGSKKAIGSTQDTIVAEDWPSWGSIFRVNATTGREQGLAAIGGYFGPQNRQIVDGLLVFIRYRQTDGPPQGAIGIADIDSGRTLWQNRERAEPAILFVSSTRVYARWSATFTQPGLLVIDRQTGTTVMQERELPKEDFIDEKDDWFVWTQSKPGQTTFINVVNGATSVNDDLRLSHLAGTFKNLLIGAQVDLSIRGRSRAGSIFAIDVTVPNAARKWRTPQKPMTYPPIVIGNKVVYGNESSLVVIDAETGRELTTTSLPNQISQIVRQQGNTLLVQTGNPGQNGTLSAISV